MAKKVSQLPVSTSIGLTDIIPFANPSTGQLKKVSVSDLFNTINIKWFGARCDYNPATGTGTDDTAAINAAIAFAGTKTIIFDGIPLARGKLNVKPYTTIIGVSIVSSIIWCDLTDPTESLFNLSAGTVDPYNGKLLNFSVYGGANCGFACITIHNASFLDFAEIDINICGGFTYYYYQTTPDAYGSLSGGIQNTQFKIVGKLPQWRWTHGFDMIAYPTNGFYNKGYINASDVYLDLQGFTGAGDAITLIGNYSSAGSSTLKFTVQGAGGRACVIDKVTGGLSVEDFYCEANGNDTSISNSSAITFVGRGFGNITLTNSNTLRISNVDRLIDSGGNFDIQFDRAERDGEPLDINTDGFTTTGYPKNNNVGSLRARTVKSLYDYRNYVVNGDFSRNAGVTAWGSDTPWGFSVIDCIATRTGPGLADTTASSEGFAIKITERPLQGYHLEINKLQIPLKGRLNDVLSVSFKYKNNGGFVEYGSLGDGIFSHQNPLDWGIPVENGFKLVRYSVRITQPMVDNGIRIRFLIPSGTLYVSEIYAGFGVGAPHNFIPYVAENIKLIGGNLHFNSDTIPTGNDPIFNQPYIAGDKAFRPNAAEGENEGWKHNGAEWIVFGRVGEMTAAVGTTNTDIEITDPTKGIIRTSPNGTRWRETINNDGSFTTTAL